MVWLANTQTRRTYLPFDEVKRLRGGCRPQVLLVPRAAYSIRFPE